MIVKYEVDALRKEHGPHIKLLAAWTRSSHKKCDGSLKNYAQFEDKYLVLSEVLVTFVVANVRFQDGFK